MKFLYSINLFNNIHPGQRSTYNNTAAIIYGKVWHNFILRYGSKIPNAEFMFLDGSFDIQYLHNQLPGVRIDTIGYSHLPSDEDMTYEAFKRGKDYDYVIRVDQDSFPSSQVFNVIQNYLESHPDIDIISPGNAKQSISLGLPNNQRKEINYITWAPWGYPTLGNCIVYCRSAYYQQALQTYLNHFKDKSNVNLKRPGVNRSLNTLDKVYQLLGKQCPPGEELYTVNIDGQIGLDFWTIMCKLGMKQVDIVNFDYRSWQNKDHISSFAEAMQFGTFDEVIDSVDLSLTHNAIKDKIVAPFFHTGSSMGITYFFDSFTHPGRSKEHFDNYFGSDFFDHNKKCFNVRAAQCAIVRLLTNSCGDSTLINKLDNNLRQLMQTIKVDYQDFIGFYNQIASFYSPAIAEYLF